MPEGDREITGGNEQEKREITGGNEQEKGIGIRCHDNKIAQTKGRWTDGPYVMRVGNPAISLEIVQRRKKLKRIDESRRELRSVEDDSYPIQSIELS